MGIPKDKLTDSIAYNSYPLWDSLKHLQLISELEEEFDIEFSMEDVVLMKNLELVKKLVGKYLV